MMRYRALFPITRATSSFVALALIGLASPLVAHAQANRGTTSRGAFGQTTLGSTTGASPSGLGSGATSGLNPAATQGGSGANNNTNMNGSSFGQVTDATGMQNLQRGGETGFVGASSATVANPFATGQAARATQNFNALTQLLTQSRQNQFNQQQAQRSQRTTGQAQGQFRVPLRLGFEPQPIATRTFTVQVSGRLMKIPGLSRVGPIEASLEGRTAVLRGTVATEADRQLAEGLARLEPEVLAVRNELVVAPPETRAEALPQASGASPQ
jgi:BON domain